MLTDWPGFRFRSKYINVNSIFVSTLTWTNITYFLRFIISEVLTILERSKISKTYLKWKKENDKNTRHKIV